MAEKKLSPSERAALVEKAFAKLPGSREDATAEQRARLDADKRAASASVGAIVDAGYAVEFEPRDGFYCVRVERDGRVMRFAGPDAAGAAECASGAAK